MQEKKKNLQVQVKKENDGKSECKEKIRKKHNVVLIGDSHARESISTTVNSQLM